MLLTTNMTSVSCLSMTSRDALISKPKTPRGVRTREALLRAAEECFSQRGFHAVSVGDIAQTGGMALGTFYLYFPDKLGVFRAVVDAIQVELRAYLRRSDDENRLSRERQGLRDFLSFACDRPGMFRILQESYVVDQDIYFSYFEGIAASYSKRLKAAQSKGEIAKGDADIQAWCLIAISNFLGMRYSRLNGRKVDVDAIVATAADLIIHGLASPEYVEPTRQVGARAQRQKIKSPKDAKSKSRAR